MALGNQPVALGNQPVALPGSYGGPDFIHACCQLFFVFGSGVPDFPMGNLGPASWTRLTATF